MGYRTVATDGEVVTYEIRFRFGSGDLVVATDRLRFAPEAGLDRLLTDAGFAAVAWHGDWDGAPISAGSPELIAIATA